LTTWFCLDPFALKLHMKSHELPHLTCDITGQHYRLVLSDVSLPRLCERRRGLKFRLPYCLHLAFALVLVNALVLVLLVKTTQAQWFINTGTKLQLQLSEVTRSIRGVPRCPTPLPATSCQITPYCGSTSKGNQRKVL